MRLPVLRGTIERRILVNYRVAPVVLARLVPPPFRLQLIDGFAIAGICLIRLRGIRPRGCPASFGFSSENAAHRIAVEWDDAFTRGNCALGAPAGRSGPPADPGDLHGAPRRGVYVPRRDSSSWFNTLVGGHLFPGVHHLSRFDVRESAGNYHVGVSHRDGLRVSVDGRATDHFPAGSLFGSLAEASTFFEDGSLGYSATREAGIYDGLELRTLRWKIEPLAIDHVASSFFEDRRLFPAGCATFDSAFLMRDIEHEWHSRQSLCCTECGADSTVPTNPTSAVAETGRAPG